MGLLLLILLLLFSYAPVCYYYCGHLAPRRNLFLPQLGSLSVVADGFSNGVSKSASLLMLDKILNFFFFRLHVSQFVLFGITILRFAHINMMNASPLRVGWLATTISSLFTNVALILLVLTDRLYILYLSPPLPLTYIYLYIYIFNPLYL